MARDINGEIIPTFEETVASNNEKLLQAAEFRQKLATPSLIATSGGSLLPAESSDAIALAALSNEHSVNPDEIFTVKSYTGEVGEVRGADLQKVLASGDYILESKEERLLREDETKYGNRNLESAALGAARGLTFGLSDVGLAGSGEYTGDELRGLENANKAMSIGGEITGVIAPTLLSGGTGAVAQGARVLTTGVRAAETLGAKAAAKVALQAEGMASRQAATAAKVLTEASTGTISKAGAEAATGVLAKSLQKSGYAVKQANNIATKMLYGTAEHLAPEAANLAVQGALQGAGRLVTEDVFGTAEMNAENLIAYAGLGALVGGTFGASVGAGKALVPKAADLLRPAGRKIGEVAEGAVDSLFGKEKAALNMFDMTPSALSKAQTKRPNFNTLAADEAEVILQKFNPKNAEEFHQAAIKYREEIGEKIGKIYKDTDDILAKQKVNTEEGTAILKDGLSPDAVQFTGNIVRAVDEHLAKLSKGITEAERKSLFGVADDFVSQISKELREEPLTASRMQEYITGLQKRIYPPKDGKITMLTEAESSANLVRKAIVDEMRKSQYELVKRAQTINGTNIAEGALTDRLRKLNQSYSVMKDATHNSKRAIARGDMSSGFDNLVDMKDAAAFLVDPGVGVGYKAARMTLNSFAVQKRLAMGALDNSGRKMANAMKSGLNTLAKGTKGLAKATEPSIVRQLVSSELAVRHEDGKKLKPRNEAEAYNNIIDNANQAVLDPEAVLRHSNKQTSALYEHAPNTAAAIDAKYLQVLQFIAEKAKKSSKNKGLFDSKNVRPSGFETAKMARYLDAITNPQSMVEKAAKGKLSREHVEVMKNIFPQMHKQMQESTLKFLAAHKDKGPKLTYQQQLQLGSLLDIQAHESTDPQNVQALQALFTRQPASEGSDFTPARADSLNKADNVGGGVYDSVDTED